MVLGFTVVHFIIFALVGMGLTLLVHLATRNIALRMGVWIGLVVAFGLYAGLTYMLGTATGERLSPWPVVTGSLLGVLGMAGYLWRRHPRLRRSFDQAPLGAKSSRPRIRRADLAPSSDTVLRGGASGHTVKERRVLAVPAVPGPRAAGLEIRPRGRPTRGLARYSCRIPVTRSSARAPTSA